MAKKSYYQKHINRLKPILDYLLSLSIKERSWDTLCLKYSDIQWKEWKSLEAKLHSLDKLTKKQNNNKIKILVKGKTLTTKELRSMSYSKYLLTSHWTRMRNIALENDGHACKLCNSTSKLHVHHRTYKNKGTSIEYKDLVVLCSKCHKYIHNNITVY